MEQARIEFKTVLLFACMVLLGASAFGLTVRTKADARYWQTVFHPEEPLAWDWDDGADSATVTFSNRVTQTVSSVIVSREGASSMGSVEFPPAGADEDFFAVDLVQRRESDEVSRQGADVVRVQGADGTPIRVRTKSSRDWSRLKAPRLSAYDPAWAYDETEFPGYAVHWANVLGLLLIYR